MMLQSFQEEIKKFPVKPSLEPLIDLLKEEMQLVDQAILEKLQSPVDFIPKLAYYLIGSGGKRIRPLLTLAVAKLCGYKGVHHTTLAAAVECIHSATLLHDDVVDESTLRRGVSSANEIWGNQASVLVGDFLFSRAFQLMVESNSLPALATLADAAATIAEGEVLQLLSVQNLGTTRDQYLEIVKSKTACLFEAAVKVGAILAEASELYQENLSNFGKYLGVAFQLIDDILDYNNCIQGFGKNIGDDFKEGKITLPLIIAYEKASQKEKEFWHRVITRLDQNENDLNQAISYLIQHEALKCTFKEAKNFAECAKQELMIFPNVPLKDALITMTDFVVFRLEEIRKN